MTLEDAGIGLFLFWCISEIILFIFDDER